MDRSRCCRATSARRSQTGRAVLEEFARRFPATLELADRGADLRDRRRHPAGLLAARRHGKFTDHASVVLEPDRHHDPGVLPRVHPQVRLRRAARAGCPRTAGRIRGSTRPTRPGFYVLDGILTGEWDAAWDAFLHLILPAIALGTIPLAIIVRITRARCSRCRTPTTCAPARAKGIGRRRPSATASSCATRMLPVITTIGLQIGPADLGGRAHRDGVRLPRHRLVPGRRDLRRATIPCCRASSSSSRSSTP